MEAATTPAQEPSRKRLNETIDWTPEAVATLERLWNDDVPTKDIAATLGNPDGRSAVIGKAGRLGLPRRQPGMPPRKGAASLANARTASLPKPAPAKPRQSPESIQPVVATRPQMVCEPAPEGGVPIHALETHHCRWIINGEREHARYCGARRLPEAKFLYCTTHHVAAVASKPTREEERIRAQLGRRAG